MAEVTEVNTDIQAETAAVEATIQPDETVQPDNPAQADEATQPVQPDEPAEAKDLAESEAAISDAAVANGAMSENVPELMVEGLSAEQNVSRLAGITKLPRKIAVYIISAIYFAVGVLCVSVTRYITEALPYIVGSLMSAVGIGGFIISLVRRDYKSIKTNKTATFILAAGLGVMIILEEALSIGDPVTMISIVWGVFGLFEGAHAFNRAITRIANSERCVYYIIKGIAECVVAFLMLYSPQSHDAHFLHIVVFGINLIIDAITMIPKVKEILTKF